jgi:hypothetical protein
MNTTMRKAMGCRTNRVASVCCPLEREENGPCAASVCGTHLGKAGTQRPSIRHAWARLADLHIGVNVAMRIAGNPAYPRPLQAATRLKFALCQRRRKFSVSLCLSGENAVPALVSSGGGINHA